MKKIILTSLALAAAVTFVPAVHAVYLPSSKGYFANTTLNNSSCAAQTKSAPSLKSCGIVQKDNVQKKEFAPSSPNLPIQPVQPAQPTQLTSPKKVIAAETPLYVECSGAYLGNDGTASSNLDSGVQCLAPFSYTIQQEINVGGKVLYTGPGYQWSVTSGMTSMHLNSNPGYGPGAFRSYILSSNTDPGTRCCCVKSGYLTSPGQSSNKNGSYTMRCDGPAAP